MRSKNVGDMKNVCNPTKIREEERSVLAFSQNDRAPSDWDQI